jgi:hypothetical protein
MQMRAISAGSSLRAGGAVLAPVVLLAFVTWACGSSEATTPRSPPIASRLDSLPDNAVKRTPADDVYPPVLHATEFAEPVPLPGPINTAGLEDSPFIAPDGRLYFFFTPSAAVPPEQQLFDGVTGIYVAAQAQAGWQEPQRVVLQDPGKLALDGCADVLNDVLWFCSAREGWSGIGWFTASLGDGEWTDWQSAAQHLPPDGPVGELHFTSDEQTLYFHSNRADGAGGEDLWRSDRDAGGTWLPAVNVAQVNTSADEGWPWLTPDGGELWFTRQYMGSPAIFRAQRTENGWSEPEMIVERFAGEPTLDAQGNLYFVHHYFRDGVMLEADLYVARRR